MATKTEEQKRELGWASAVNLISPVPRRRLLFRGLVLRIINSPWQLERARKLRLVGARPTDETLRTLNHLHFARWSLVWRLPRVGDAAPERGGHTLLLFTSYFDFGWRRYLGTFIETTGDGLSRLWGDIAEWRRPSDGARQFENFVVDQQVPHGHLYAAFPGLSCNDIRNRVRLYHEIQAVRATLTQLDAEKGVSGPVRDAKRMAVRRAFSRRVQHCLVFPDREAENVDEVSDLQVNPSAGEPVTRDPSPQGITCIVPYHHQNEQGLREALDALEVGTESPFAHLPGTHFARLALIGRDHFIDRSVPPLANGYLLLSAELDGEVGEWLQRLSARAELDPIWRHCHGYRGFASLPDLLGRCRVRPSVEYQDYPGVTVAEIVKANDVVRQHLWGLLDVSH